MKRRIFCTLLAVTLLLSGCAGQTAGSLTAETPPVDSGTIAYVPLDDRPDNVERVVYLAESLGYTLEMPEADWYQTKLDGQPLNGNGTQYGDMAALYEWVLEQEAAGCDRYILSLDQLLSGGLVNSRHTSETVTVALSGGTELTDREFLENLLTALAADGNNRVWLLDSVMRLAPTCGYAGFGLEEYNALRAYGAQPRPALAGGGLTVSKIVADYRLGGNGTALKLSDFGLTAAQVDAYLAARERKLELAERLLETVQGGGYGNFRVLIGIDDSSAEDSIQKNEIAYLRSLLREGDALLAGVDDLAFKAVTRLYLEERTQPSLAEQGLNDVYVDFFGGTENRPACDYDSQPLREVVAEHLAFFGMEEAPERLGADLQLVVLTQPEAPARAAEYYRALIARLNDNQAHGLPTILMDAGNNAYGTAFHDTLVEECGLGWLLSYSGFLDMAIVTGTALSHGVARYAWLCDGNGGDPEANRAFQKSLTESIVLDFCYRNTVRDDLSAYVRQSGGDPNNFYAPAIDTEAVRQKLGEGMEQSTKDVLRNLSRSNLIVSLEEFREQSGGTAGWGKVSLSDWSFPWQRVFEVRMKIEINDLTKAHKSILGFTF